MPERVLLIDDEPEFLESLAERMRLRDMEVDTATSAAEALEFIEQGTYDAVVLDLMMPDMDGIGALQALKERQPELEVVLLSGHGSVAKSVEAMKLGARDFLEKPVDIAVLTERVHDAHEKRVLLVEKELEEKLRGIMKTRAW